MKWGSSTVAPPIEIDIHSKQEKQLAKKKKQTAMAAITSSFNLFVLIIVIADVSGQGNNNAVLAPSFGSTMSNITVIKGRDASFTCVVLNIGVHRVAWIKADDKGILAMHDRVLTNNARLSVMHSDLHTWTLHIRDVRRSDRGNYMCQINTDPMRSQTASLEVVIPPDILSEEGGSEVLVPEGGSARLSCKARGVPQPRVTWRREDSSEIVIRNGAQPKQRVASYDGEVLSFHKITRSEMGAYLCIANNGVPPSVSRRIVVNVHFYPIIQVHNQLIGAPLGSNITLDCLVEASPKPIYYWARDTGEYLMPSEKYRMEEIDVNTYTTRLRLHLRISSVLDEGAYKCAAKNSIGDSEGTIQIYVTKPVEEKEPSPELHWTYSQEEDINYSEEVDEPSRPTEKVERVTPNSNARAPLHGVLPAQNKMSTAHSGVPRQQHPPLYSRSFTVISLALSIIPSLF